MLAIIIPITIVFIIVIINITVQLESGLLKGVVCLRKIFHGNSSSWLPAFCYPICGREILQVFGLAPVSREVLNPLENVCRHYTMVYTMGGQHTVQYVDDVL